MDAKYVIQIDQTLVYPANRIIFYYKIHAAL